MKGRAGAFIVVSVSTLVAISPAAPGSPRTTDRTAGSGIRILASGFSQREGEIGVGVIVRNTSSSLAALGVELTINAVSASGRLVGTESDTVSVIPAGAVFYDGTDLISHGKAARLEVYAQVDHRSSHRYRLPAVSNVRIERDPYLGVRVTGELRNTLNRSLSSLSRIGIVIFDRARHVVGGGFTYPDADVPPGRRVLFDAGNGVDTVSPTRAFSARASAENSSGFEPIP